MPTTTPEPVPGGLQEAVRDTRARLDRAVVVGDQAGVEKGIAELRAHAARAAREMDDGDFESRAAVMLRELADETERGLKMVLAMDKLMRDPRGD